MRRMRTPEIIRIPILPLGMVNAHAIRTAAGCVLIDAGIPGSEAKIGRALARHGLSYDDIKLIVITHAHTDHAGCAANLRKLSGAPILAHEKDLEFFNHSKPMTFCPSSWVGRLFLKTPVPHTPYEGFEPDILMSDGQNVGLEEFGVDGFVRHTAGHTPGSVVVELGSNDVMVGDLVASGILIGGIARSGRAISPPFEDDPHTISRELQRLIDGGAKRFHMGHGGPLGAAEVQRHARRLSKKPPAAATPSASCMVGSCDHASH
jgi:hydroxyacylglutathione hydrolase